MKPHSSVPKNTSAIIPFYNEGQRVLTVLKYLTKVGNLLEIIGVDDGSTDNASWEIQRKYPEVKLVLLRKNRGKSAALLRGFLKSSGRNILLFDADLCDFQPKQIEKAITVFQNHEEIEMIILRRINDPWIYRLLRTDTVISGQRLLRARDLGVILKTKVGKFQIELAINHYMIQHQKTVFWFPFSYRHVYKIQKYGLLSGMWREIEMFKNLLFYQNPLYYFKMLASFCRDKYQF